MISILKINNLNKDLKKLSDLLKDLGIKNDNQFIKEILEERFGEKKFVIIEKDFKQKEVFLITKKYLDLILDNNIDEEVIHFGLKIGTIRKHFIPTRELLEIILKKSNFKINYLVVNEKSEWLFICNRDIFLNGIVKENKIYGNLFLILNKNNECLGLGYFRNKKIVKNFFDIGDFLRREKKGLD